MSLQTSHPTPGTGAQTALQVGWGVLAVAAAVALARVTMASPQLGCSVALFVLCAGTYVRSRRVGLAVMWGTWFVAPLLRRLFGLETGYVGSDPLALIPFLNTAALVAIELRLGGLPQPLRRPLALAGLGLAIGLPLGFVSSPNAAAFAFVAYGSGIAALVLGYRDSTSRDSEGSLLRALGFAMPWMALYAVYQYFDLPHWDKAWLEATQFVQAGSPVEEHVRVWSTLNSPGTFGMTIGLALVAALSARRFSVARIVGTAVMLFALVLTYVRSAWVALAAAGIVLLIASRGRMSHRLAVALAIAFIGLPAAIAGSPTGAAVGARFESFFSLGQDTSAQARQQTTLSVVPKAAAKPLGFGLGSAGESARLGSNESFRNTDDAYLSALYQVGPFGFLLLASAAAYGVRRAWRVARRPRSGPLALTLISLIVFCLVGMLTGDLLFGVTGVAFWYVLGLGIRESERLSMQPTPRKKGARLA